MRRRNRKISKRMSVIAGRSMQIAAVMLILFVMVIVNQLASSNCDQLTKVIREKERQLAKLEDERSRESARWEEMKTPEKLESALMRHGLSMRYPKADQVVRMKSDGRPYPGQVSVARAQQRRKQGTTARR